LQRAERCLGTHPRQRRRAGAAAAVHLNDTCWPDFAPQAGAMAEIRRRGDNDPEQPFRGHFTCSEP